MASKKSTSSFHSELSKIGGGAFSGAKRDNWLQGFKPSQSIAFGKPSSSKALTPGTSHSGFDWAGMAQNIASGGIGSVFGSTSGNSPLSLLGLGSLISGIGSLFGGQKAELPALKLFQLPSSINQTVHTQGGAASAVSNSAVHVHVQAFDSQSFVSRSNDIARAVKTAMLNSHSLNDVVAEL